MLGRTRKINWSHWLRLKVLAFTVVAAALLPAVAPAGLTGDVDKASQLPAVSPGISSPDGYQPQLQGDAPLVAPAVPDGYEPQLRRSGEPTVYMTARPEGSSTEARDVGLGFALGVLLAAGCAIALVATRRGMRPAHT